MQNKVDIDKFYQIVVQRLQEVSLYLRNSRGKVQDLGKSESNTLYGSALTYMDMFVQDYIMVPLFNEFPFLVPMVEEATGMKLHFKDNSSDYVLIIDPIDGTYFYINGDKDYSTMVALLYKGTPLLGIGIYPETEEIYAAIKGKGAWRIDKTGQKETLPNPQHIKTDPKNISALYRFKKEPFSELAQNLIEKGYNIAINGKEFGTNLSGILRIVHGKSCAFIGPNIALHDFIVPAFIVQESGGVVVKFKTDFPQDVRYWEIDNTQIFTDLDPNKPPPRYKVIIANTIETAHRVLQDMLN